MNDIYTTLVSGTTFLDLFLYFLLHRLHVFSLHKLQQVFNMIIPVSDAM